MADTLMLVVEDNPGDVRILRYAFAETQGWPVRLVVAEDGEKAIAYLRHEPPFGEVERPQAVILDLNVPKIGGADVLRAIRSNSELRDLPVIVLSSSPQDVIASQFRDAQVEADCYLTKPPDVDEFLAIGMEIRRCCDEARSRRTEPDAR